MKYLFLLLLLISGACYGQTKYYIRADSTVLEKVGGSNELILLNGTKARTGAYLKNTLNGRTGWFYAVDSAYISGSNLVLVRGGGAQNVTVGIGGGTIGGSIALNQVAFGSGANTIQGLGLNTGALRVLSQTSSGAPAWTDPAGLVTTTPTWQQTLTAGNTQSKRDTINSAGFALELQSSGKRMFISDPGNKYWAFGDWAGDFNAATSIHIIDSTGTVRIDGDLNVQSMAFDAESYDPANKTRNFPAFYNSSSQYIGGGTGVDSVYRDADSIYFRVRSSVSTKAGIKGIRSSTTTGTVTGSGTTNYVPKWTSSTAQGNSQIFDNGTSVGIGTITPTSGKLEIVKASTYNSETTAGLSILSVAAGGAGTELLLGTDNANQVAYLQSAQQATSYTSRSLGINPNGGNVGIGAALPIDELLTVGQSGGSNGQIGIWSSGNGAAGTMGKIIYKMNVGGGNPTSILAEISTVAAVAGNHLDFKVGSWNNNNSVGSTLMSIVSTGTVQMTAYGAGTATFDGSGNITSVSDVRVKHNIKPFTYGLDAILKLKTSSFIYNQDKSNTVMSGFIAQDVQKVIPIAVHQPKEKDGMMSLETNAIIAALVNGMQEQQKQIEELQKEIKKLKRN